MNKIVRLVVPAVLALLVAGCATISHRGDSPLSVKEQWGVAQLANNTETPYAAERATAILGTLMRGRGIDFVETRIADRQPEKASEGQPSSRVAEAIEKGRQNNLRYLVIGSVIEWRYKAGLDGEPVSGITLQVLDIRGGKVAWSGSAARSGWGRESLSGVGQKVISSLVEAMPLAP